MKLQIKIKVATVIPFGNDTTANVWRIKEKRSSSAPAESGSMKNAKVLERNLNW